MKEFLIDATVLVTFKVPADNLADAKKLIREQVDGNLAYFGAWPDGSPVLAEIGIEGELDWQGVLIDGKEVEQ